MSTKTNFKRVALVAVASLGLGVLTSVAPASATANGAVGDANTVTAAGILNVATFASITGAVTLSASGAGVASTSVGLLANSTTITASSLTSTATMRSDGKLVFYYTATTSGAAVTAEVTGGTITAASQSAGSNNFNAASTQVVTGPATTAAAIFNFAVAPSTGSTSMTVSLYETAAAAAGNGSAAALVDIQSGLVSRGALVQRYVVTVATTSVSGVYSATYSTVAAQTYAGIGAPATSVDQTDSTTIANVASSVAYISFNLRDAYNVSLAGKGALIVSATNGAGVSLKNTTDGTYGGASSVTLLSAVSNFASGTVTVARPTALANKGFSTTVTISWNGAVVGTKTFKFQGEVAKITVSADYVAQNNTTSAGVGSVSYVDDAGNALLPSSGTSAVSSTLNASVTGVSGFSAPTAAYPYSDYDVSCGGSEISGLGSGTADVVFQFVNPVSGSIVKSAATKIRCYGNATSFAASWDKATYAPGDIATLTISGKDAAGNVANSFDSWMGTGSTLFSITTPTNLTIVTAISTTSVGFTSGDGIKTYKFIVGTTEGTFNAIVAAGVISAHNVSAGGAGVANATVKYTVASTSTAISLADVLKAIVSLIASINKQIAALQKALLKK
jgi:hypothetical protein